MHIYRWFRHLHPWDEQEDRGGVRRGQDEHQRGGAVARAADRVPVPGEFRGALLHRAAAQDHDHQLQTDVPERVGHGAPHQQLPHAAGRHQRAAAGLHPLQVLRRKLPLVALPVVLLRGARLRIQLLPDLRDGGVPPTLLLRLLRHLHRRGHDLPLHHQLLAVARLRRVVGDHVAVHREQEGAVVRRQAAQEQPPRPQRLPDLHLHRHDHRRRPLQLPHHPHQDVLRHVPQEEEAGRGQAIRRHRQQHREAGAQLRRPPQNAGLSLLFFY